MDKIKKEEKATNFREIRRIYLFAASCHFSFTYVSLSVNIVKIS